MSEFKAYSRRTWNFWRPLISDLQFDGTPKASLGRISFWGTFIITMIKYTEGINPPPDIVAFLFALLAYGGVKKISDAIATKQSNQ